MSRSFRLTVPILAQPANSVCSISFCLQKQQEINNGNNTESWIPVQSVIIRAIYPLNKSDLGLFYIVGLKGTAILGQHQTNEPDKNIVLEIHQFRYVKIQPKTINIRTRPLGITTESVGLIAQSLPLNSIVLD